MYQQTGQTHLPARRPMNRKVSPASATARRLRQSAAAVEPLEGRSLFAVQIPVTLSAEPPVNVTQLLENQHTSVIAVNRTDPGAVFVATVHDRRVTGPLDDRDLDNDNDPDQLTFFEDTDGIAENDIDHGILGGVSINGGRDFELSALSPGAMSPSAAYDRFGNLFVTYFTQAQEVDEDDPDGGFVTVSNVVVAMSTDNGLTFETINTIEVTGFEGNDGANPLDPDGDAVVIQTDSPQPSIAVGNDSVWISYESDEIFFDDSNFFLDGGIFATGARVLGLGAVEPFIEPEPLPRSSGGKFSDIAIGPGGEVMVTYEILRDDPDALVDQDIFFNEVTIVNGQIVARDESAGPGEIFVNVDPDGLGSQEFGRRFKVTDTNVGIFDPIPAQNTRAIDASPSLAWDRSGGPFNGRIWLVYTDEARDESNSDTEIYLRFSDDDGATWSSRRQVNDEDVTEGSQFLPNIALDQTTGNIAITWYDTRFQNNISQGANDETQYFGTVGVPTVAEAGIAFADNIQLSTGFSDAPRARNVFEYGEYSDLDFHNNVFYAVWTDNSGSTGDNPSGGVNSGLNLSTFDAYTTRVTVLPNSPRPPELEPVGPGSPLTPDFVGKNTVTKGKNFKFQVRYESPNGIDQSTLGDDDLLITGPNGYNLFADFTKAKQARRGTIVTATYLAFAPGGKWDVGDNGLYTILLQGGSVAELGGAVISVDGLLDQFLVSSTAQAQSPALQPAAPRSVSQSATSAANHSADEDDDKWSALGL